MKKEPSKAGERREERQSEGERGREKATHSFASDTETWPNSPPPFYRERHTDTRQRRACVCVRTCKRVRTHIRTARARVRARMLWFVNQNLKR